MELAPHASPLYETSLIGDSEKQNQSKQALNKIIS